MNFHGIVGPTERGEKTTERVWGTRSVPLSQRHCVFMKKSMKVEGGDYQNSNTIVEEFTVYRTRSPLSSHLTVKTNRAIDTIILSLQRKFWKLRKIHQFPQCQRAWGWGEVGF